MKKNGSFMNRYLFFGGKGLAIDGSSEKISNGSGYRLRPRSDVFGFLKYIKFSFFTRKKSELKIDYWFLKWEP